MKQLSIHLLQTDTELLAEDSLLVKLFGFDVWFIINQINPSTVLS